MQVFKFGGVSVKDANSIKNVANILKNKVNEPTVVGTLSFRGLHLEPV